MKTGHLSEPEIQQYAVDQTNCSPEVKMHIAICADCKNKVVNYDLLLNAIKEQPVEIIEFDMSLLIPKNTLTKAYKLTDYVAGFLVLVMLAAPFYCYRQLLVQAFKGTPATLAGAVTLLAILVVIFQGLSLFYKGSRQIEILN
jgi:hypothetical protein